jgi:hypothetical protein
MYRTAGVSGVYVLLSDISSYYIRDGYMSTMIFQPTILLSPDEIRLGFLSRAYLEIAGNPDSLSPDVADWVRHGGNLRLSLYEIAQLMPPTEEEIALQDVRKEYLDSLYAKNGTRQQRAEEREAAREKYIDSIVARMAKHVDAKTDEEALELRQMPTLVHKTTFEPTEEPLSSEVLTANHLALLLDIVLTEHVRLLEGMTGYHEKGAISKFLIDRKFRMTIATAVFILALVPNLHILPTPEEELTEEIELALKGLTALIILREAPALLSEKLAKLKRDRQHAQRIARIAIDKDMSDSVLRMTYNSTRYGGRRPGYKVTGRHATDDPNENAKRLQNIEHEFAHLNNDPGGKRYDCHQALNFAERILVDKSDLLDNLLAELDPENQRKLFLDLTREIVTQDLTVAEKHSRFRKLKSLLKFGLPMLSAIIATNGAVVAAEAKTIATDTAHQLPKKHEEKPERG